MTGKVYIPKQNGIHVVIAGGTIDFHSNPTYEMQSGEVDSLLPRQNSIIPYFLRERVKVPQDEVIFSRACMKDSRELTDKDRAKILDEVKKSPYEQILVTHGIVEMDKTKDYLANHKEKLNGKTVGIVGSRMPLSEHRSDGGFQLGFAIGEMQSSKSGLYAFHPDYVKEKAEKLFENTVFLITGGTIDSSFSERADTAVSYKHSKIPDYFKDTLGIVPIEPDFVFKEICMKDSRELSEVDIRLLLQEAQNQSYKNQIITAGTYTLPDLASRFKLMVDHDELPESKYVFVGAMLPDDVHLNDGWFNVGYALGRKNKLKDGVYVSMHSWITPPENVMKQLQEARFKLYDDSVRGKIIAK